MYGDAKMPETKTKIVLEGGAKRPFRAHPGDAGYDLYTNEEVYVFPGQTVNVHTGVKLALPDGIWIQIMSRSSTLRIHGLQVIEAVIDNGYRGEMLIQVFNPGTSPVRVEKGMRLAQMIPHKIIDLNWHDVGILPDSSRGDSGFGSSGQ